MRWTPAPLQWLVIALSLGIGLFYWVMAPTNLGVRARTSAERIGYAALIAGALVVWFLETRRRR